MFKLNERLEQDSVYICDLALCELRLLKDGELEWFILIPKKEDIIELTDLEFNDQTQLLKELNFVIERVSGYHQFQKINFGALGNMVSQFHLHIIFRQLGDRAWPGSIWGSSSSIIFDEDKLKTWRGIFNE